MKTEVDGVAVGVFVFFLLLVTVLGFVAARWRRPDTMAHLDEWGLGGRKFGTWITWFLVGGDFYTAYTVIAVPALVYAVGAYGFFALPYTIIVYPFVFAVMPRLWHLARDRRVRHRSGRGARAIRLAAARACGGVDGSARHHAVHRAPAGGDGGVDPGARAPWRATVDRRVHDPGRLHLLLGSPGSGADRLRQGHDDLHRGPGGGRDRPRRSSEATGRCSTPPTPPIRARPAQGCCSLRDSPSLRHAGAGLGAGGLHVSTHLDRDLRLLARPTPSGRTRCSCRPTRCSSGCLRSSGTWATARDQARPATTTSCPRCSSALPVLVRRVRVRGDRHRRAGAGGGDVIGSANLFTRNFWKAYVDPDGHSGGRGQGGQADVAWW